MKYKFHWDVYSFYNISVCLSIEFKISPMVQNNDTISARQWTLGSCSGPKYDMESFSSMTIYYYDRCCLLPGKYTLTCSNIQHTYGWGNVTFTIDGKQYCDDFVGFEAMRTVTVKGKPTFVASIFVKSHNKVS